MEDWIKFELIWLGSLPLEDKFIRCLALEHLQTPGKIVRVDEV